MVNGKVTELGTSQTHQPCLRFTEQREASISDSGAFNGDVQRFSDTGIPVYSASQSEQGEDSYSGRFCGVYSQTATQPDQPGKEICGFQRDVDQQSGPYCTGRILSKEGAWQKRRNKLRYHLPTIVCGSKNSLRYIISLSRSKTLIVPLNIPLMK
jgi:hypothetical protein